MTAPHEQTVTLEYWQDDQWLVGHLREVPWVFSQGATLDELQANIREVYRLWQEEGEPAGLYEPAPADAKTLLMTVAA